MFSKLLELITGKDDLERVVSKEKNNFLNRYLKTRRVWIPKRPKRFLDASAFTPEQLLELTRQDAEELENDDFYPWILERDGLRWLPVFSSLKRTQVFSAKMSQDMDKVFFLGMAECLLEAATKTGEVDCVVFNPFSKHSWEITIEK